MRVLKGFYKHAKNTHWLSKTVIKFGVILSTFLLFSGFIIDNTNYELAIKACSTSVSLFSIAIIGGLLIDVVAKRRGEEE